MKLIARIIIILAASYLLSFYAPWWILMIISFLVGFSIYGGGFTVFLSGFLGGGLLWLSYSWYLDYQTQSILSEKIVNLFPFDDKLYLIILSGLIGGLASGFAAITGNSLRLIFVKKKSKSFYS